MEVAEEIEGQGADGTQLGQTVAKGAMLLDLSTGICFTLLGKDNKSLKNSSIQTIEHLCKKESPDAYPAMSARILYQSL